MKITFIGGGNMAGAIIGGLVRDGFGATGVRASSNRSRRRARN